MAVLQRPIQSLKHHDYIANTCISEKQKIHVPFRDRWVQENYVLFDFRWIGSEQGRKRWLKSLVFKRERKQESKTGQEVGRRSGTFRTSSMWFCYVRDISMNVRQLPRIMWIMSVDGANDERDIWKRTKKWTATNEDTYFSHIHVAYMAFVCDRWGTKECESMRRRTEHNNKNVYARSIWEMECVKILYYHPLHLRILGIWARKSQREEVWVEMHFKPRCQVQFSNCALVLMHHTLYNMYTITICLDDNELLLQT